MTKNSQQARNKREIPQFDREQLIKLTPVSVPNTERMNASP